MYAHLDTTVTSDPENEFQIRNLDLSMAFLWFFPFVSIIVGYAVFCSCVFSFESGSL